MELFLVAAAVFVAVLVIPRPASAHCDTADGPTATDGRRALETGNINIALKWVMPDHEGELRTIFALAQKVRGLSPDAQQLADQYFLESLVRIHRAGEGAPFEGLKPHGTPIEPMVAAADQALVDGDVAPVLRQLPPERRPELARRFRRALALRDHDVDDLAAARSFIAAYVEYFKYAEGEEHAHVHPHHVADHAHHLDGDAHGQDAHDQVHPAGGAHGHDADALHPQGDPHATGAGAE